MRHGLFIWIVGVIAVAAAMPAEAADDGWYVEGDVGEAVYPQAQFIVHSFDPKDSDWRNKYEDRQTGFRLLATYKFDRYWGLEGGFVALGQASGETTCVGKNCSPDIGDVGSYHLNVSGFQGDVIADYPFSDAWSLFGRAGLIAAATDLSETQDTGLFGQIDETNTSVEPTFGIGVGWKVAEDFQVRLGWDRYLGRGNSDSKLNLDISLISIGLQYHFAD